MRIRISNLFKNTYFHIAGVLVLIALALLLLLFNSAYGYQAGNAMMAQVRFEGEYRIADGEWHKIVEGEHIPSNKGDVTLRGNFQMFTPDGEYVGVYNDVTPIAFYLDHISVTFYGNNTEMPFDVENYLLGESACCARWEAQPVYSDGAGQIELLVHNPHLFGNETAIDEMLSRIAIWGDLNFERSIMNSSKIQLYTGLFLVIISFVLLGFGLFSTLLHIQNNRIIWMIGIAVLSAGLYFSYSTVGVSFWSESIVVNTSFLGFSMMFYMLFVSLIITYFLTKTKRLALVVSTSLGVSIGVFLLLPVLTVVSFYDTWFVWVITQSVANVLLLACLISEFTASSNKERWINIGLSLLLVAFEADVIATALGAWKGGVLSKYAFFVLFLAALFVVLRLIPDRIKAADKAKELELHKSRLEAELKESRVAIMLSQIQPHFIYNTLGTIERMCLKDPNEAFNLVRNFSLYLRGNFSELDSVTPIRFSEELKHVEHYVNIEKVRFPDMNIEYDMETTDFLLPALSVQPLVENAIKHGLMRLESGGTVIIHSYETPSHYCVEVKDNGVGFDTSAPIEDKKHVGLRNIRGRLAAMVNGELILDSTPGAGTRAVIMIPKEVIN